MRKELELKLVLKYPNLYRYDGWDNIQQSLMGFGFSCGDGWYDILDKLSSQIQYEIDLHNRATRFFRIKRLVHRVLYTTDGIPRGAWKFIGWWIYNLISNWSNTLQDSFKVSQVKEKFGGLRYNTYGFTDAIHALINEAEEQSWKTCEDCGFSLYGYWYDFKDKNERHIKVKTWKTSWIRTLCEDCLVIYLKEHYNDKVTISDVDPEVKKKN